MVMEILKKLQEILSLHISGLSVSRLVIAFTILFLFLLFKQIFSRIIVGILRKLTKKTKTTIDDKLLEIIEKPLKFIIGILGFYFAAITLNLGDSYNSIFLKFLISFIIFDITWALYRAEKMFTLAAESFFKKNNYALGLGFIPFFNKFIKFSVITFGTILIVQEWGYNIGAIITGLGIGGLAVALAAKDTLANLFGSIMILFDRPFMIGDWILMSDIEGIVEDIGFRSTKIRTFANSLVSVPNSHVANGSIENFSKRNKRRIKFVVGVTYSTKKDTLNQAVKNIRNMLENHPDIHKDVIHVYFTEFADSSLNIFIYCFTKTTVWSNFLSVRQDVNFKIMEIMEELNIDFAFPSMSVYLEKNNE